MNTTYQLKILTRSNVLIGSGEGFGVHIDSDIVFDEFGLPFIPAKRIKGCLLDSANKVNRMFLNAGIGEQLLITNVFGNSGSSKSAPVYFGNLVLDEIQQNREWLQFLTNKFSEFVNKDVVMNSLTVLRQQTRIDEEYGSAANHSLRNARVLKKGISFVGEIWIDINEIDPNHRSGVINTIAFACQNLRSIGTMRNRGFGEVKCQLFEGNIDVTNKVIMGLENV